MTLVICSVDIIPMNAMPKDSIFFLFFFDFPPYHNTKANIATSTGSVRDIRDDMIAVGKAPLLRLPVA
jgi:hypothetical protein